MQFVQMPLSAVIYNDADEYYCDENYFQTFQLSLNKTTVELSFK